MCRGALWEEMAAEVLTFPALLRAVGVVAVGVGLVDGVGLWGLCVWDGDHPLSALPLRPLLAHWGSGNEVH